MVVAKAQKVSYRIAIDIKAIVVALRSAASNNDAKEIVLTAIAESKVFAMLEMVVVMDS